MATNPLPEGITAIKTGQFTPSSSVQSYTITHNLGVQCKGFMLWLDNCGGKDTIKSYNPVCFLSALFFKSGQISSDRMQIAGRYVTTSGNLTAISKQDSAQYMGSSTIQFRSVGGYFNPLTKDANGNEIDAVYKWVAWG